MKKSILTEALRIAREKLINHPENKKHYSFVVWDGKLLDWATNKNRGRGKRNLVLGYREDSKSHREFEVINRCRGYSLKDSAIINIRLSKQGKTRLSKPCQSCAKLLEKNKIVEVYYSVDGDKFERFNV